MKFYSSDIVEKVRKERHKGLTLRALEKKFGIPNPTISVWVRDIQSNNAAYKSARAKEAIWDKQYSEIVGDLKITSDLAKTFVGLLYWCEGAKYPSSHYVAFSNSDFNLAKTFIELLRKGFDIQEGKFRASLQIHSTHNYNDLLEFWSTGLRIAPEKFYKPTITHPTKTMKRRNYLGTCTVRYYDVSLLVSIMGIYKSFAKIYEGERRGG